MKRCTVLSMACMVFLTACASLPRDALDLTEERIKQRQVQTRLFNVSEKQLLAAIPCLLQDLGYIIDDSEAALGVVVASKNCSARRAGEIAPKFALLSMLGPFYLPLYTKGIEAYTFDRVQMIRVSVVTTPVLGQESTTIVRPTFQRIILNDLGKLTGMVSVEADGIYRDFFDKLSKALFLEAEELR